MILGFKVIKEVKEIILEQIKNAQISRGVPHYWSTGGIELVDNYWLIPFTDSMIETVLREGKRPLDFPEGQQLLAMLGGLEARVLITQNDIKDVGGV